MNSPLFLKLSVDAGARDIVTDNRDFGGGVVSVLLHRKDGGRSVRHGVVIKKSMPIRAYSDIIYVDQSVASVEVALRFLRAEGVFTVRNPELSVMAEFPNYKTTRKVLVAFWCLLGVWLIYWAVINLPLNSSLVVAGGLSIVVLVGVLMPGGMITAFNNSLFSVLPTGIAVAVEQLLAFFFGTTEAKAPSVSLSKFAHFLVFFFVGVLAGRGFRKFGVVYGIALVVVFAVVTEALQTLVFGRSTSLRDVYIDSIGGILGLLSVISIILICEKLAFGKKQKNQSNLEI